MTDKEFLNWLSDRLIHVYGESPSVDFVHRLNKIAKREWVGLTDEQIDEVTQQWAGHSMVSLDRLVMCREYAKAIEAAHGIKGEA